MSKEILRFADNPIFRPEDIPPSSEGLVVEGVFNPGAFRYNGRVGLVMRVAERALCSDKELATLIIDEDTGRIKPWIVSRNDPLFRQVDPRGFYYNEKVFLTTMSHLLLAWSDDGGKHFTIDPADRIFPCGETEAYGIEDCRVEKIDDQYHLLYTAVSQWGMAVGHITTRDWKNFSPHSLILPPENKDCAIFPRKIGGRHYCLHRPSAGELGGNNIWIMSSTDLVNWGDQRPLVSVRPSFWDEQRIGAGASPVETEDGWLEIYHGADGKGRYCLGALLLDLNEPWKVKARSQSPIMEPTESYEAEGFYGDCIFTNGHVLDGDNIILYYGASDCLVCGAVLSIGQIMDSFVSSPDYICV